MYYLKCDRCGHYNPMDTPYRVYCESCKTHLRNNFIDWLNNNPDKSFDDFKIACCVSEKDIPLQKTPAPPVARIKPVTTESVEKVKRKRRLTSAQWAGIIAGAIFMAVGSYLGKSAAKVVREKLAFYKMEYADFKVSNLADWKTFTCGEGGFSVLFPGDPVENVQDAQTDLGTITVKQYTFEPTMGKDDNLLYGAGFTFYPEETINSERLSQEDLETVFQNSVQGSANAVQGKILTVSEISFQGYPGREAEVAVFNGQGIVKLRTILVKNKMLFFQVIVPAKNNPNDSVNRFFDSFRLTEEL